MNLILKYICAAIQHFKQKNQNSLFGFIYPSCSYDVCSLNIRTHFLIQFHAVVPIIKLVIWLNFLDSIVKPNQS